MLTSRILDYQLEGLLFLPRPLAFPSLSQAGSEPGPPTTSLLAGMQRQYSPVVLQDQLDFSVADSAQLQAGATPRSRQSVLRTREKLNFLWKT